MTRSENYQEAMRFARDMEEEYGDLRTTHTQVMNDFMAIAEDLAAEDCEDDGGDLAMTAWKCAWLAAEGK